MAQLAPTRLAHDHCGHQQTERIDTAAAGTA